ncbi:nitroreductase family protein (plasmid) [Deinococcus taeanensis]|uniref:nitroreductase family protein n=1 Tax=Deinococcus taeanensis TaxID=2737050 RepID=UPI001CDD71AC|nr:nitroreductase family protein [Deinococcus taeanensis]UBV44583.1 nitroreductase family protein [Deinococcus taeanensis]
MIPRPTPTFQDLYPGFPEPEFEPLAFRRRSLEEMRRRAQTFYEDMAGRRTTRQFSPEPVPVELIELAVQDPDLKRQMREAAEDEEYRTYTQRMPEEWRAALAPLGTDYVKTHLTDAPWVVVLFREKYGLRADGSASKNYYTTESVAIPAGLFIAAVHHAGLTTLTHTPNPMGFLGELLGRPKNEEAMLVMPVGHPAEDACVPRLARKALGDIFQVDRGE